MLINKRFTKNIPEIKPIVKAEMINTKGAMGCSLRFTKKTLAETAPRQRVVKIAIGALLVEIDKRKAKPKRITEIYSGQKSINLIVYFPILEC